MAKKWLRRTAIAAAAALLLIAVAGAWVAYRVTRQPAWYNAAIDCSVEPAHEAEQNELIGFRNWLARCSAGNPDQLPDSDRRYEITLTSDQLNALLAKWTDGLQGQYTGLKCMRVKLGDDEMTVQGTAASDGIESGRVIGLRLRCQTPVGDRPSIWIDSIRVGEQGVPLSWANAKPIAKLQAELQKAAQGSHGVDIDAHGIATSLMFKAYSLWLVQSLTKGFSVQPTLMLSPQLSEQSTVPLAVTALHSDGQKVTATFQLLTPPEQQTLIEKVKGIVAEAK